jgi:hypothetical protein
MKTFECIIYDKDGLWGSLRQEAESEAQARLACLKWLHTEHRRGATNIHLSTIRMEILPKPESNL